MIYAIRYHNCTYFLHVFFFVQNAIVSHECNGMDIIVALVLNEINPLSKHRMDLVMELKVSVQLFCTFLIFAM